MPVVIKDLGNESVRSALKRHLLRLIDNNQVVFEVKNLGLRRLPQAYRVAGEKQYEGHYFLINFDGPPEGLRLAKLLACKDSEIIKCHSCAVSMTAGAHHAGAPNAPACEFGEIRNPNYEKTNKTKHGFRSF
nr:cysteine rich secretory protein LCCL [Hymenolepis microstoma]